MSSTAPTSPLPHFGDVGSRYQNGLLENGLLEFAPFGPLLPNGLLLGELLPNELPPNALLPPAPELDCPVTASCPKLLADCEVIPLPPPLTLTDCLSISSFGSYQNSHAS